MKIQSLTIVLLALLVPVIAFVFVAPIAQPADYFLFADDRRLLGVNNFWNVVTNLPLLLVGVRGLQLDGQKGLVHDNPPGYPVYRWFFAGLLLTAFGSAWFHLAPDLWRLAWDRLPMTLAFTSLTTGVLAEHMGPGLEKQLLYPLLATGLASVIYWYATELAGSGDLRPYLLVQFMPVVLLPVAALACRSRFSRTADLAWLLACYGLAKLAEIFDRSLYDLLGFSGHSIKHLLAAAGSLVVLRMLMERRPCAAPGTTANR